MIRGEREDDEIMEIDTYSIWAYLISYFLWKKEYIEWFKAEMTLFLFLPFFPLILREWEIDEYSLDGIWVRIWSLSSSILIMKTTKVGLF